MKALLIGISTLLLIVLGPACVAQQEEPKQEPPRRSTATSYQSRVPEPDSKVLYSLYQPHTRNYLPGNRCLEEYTRQLGFQYVVLPPNQNSSKSDLGMRLHNMGTRMLLLLKNGPFWHHRLNQRIKECKQKSGDYMG